PMRTYLTKGSIVGLFVVLFGGLAFTILLIAVIVGPNAPWVGACAIVPVLVYVFGVLIPMKFLVVNRTILARAGADDGVDLFNVDEAYAAALASHREKRPVVPVARLAPPLDD